MKKLNALKQNALKLNVLLILIPVLSLALEGCSTKKDTYKGMTATQIYTEGQKNMAKADYAKAIKDFEALEARYPYGEYSHPAQLALINAYYKRGDYALALSTADRFIRMNPRDPQVDYAYYLKGLVSYEQNTTFMYRYLPIDRSLRDSTPAHESFLAFKDLVTQFPSSQYAPEARQRMIYLSNQLANHELHIANYYMKREAYLAAANRANYIVKHYECTTAVPEALCTLVTAYRCLGMMELSEAAQKILDTNFPDSKR